MYRIGCNTVLEGRPCEDYTLQYYLELIEEYRQYSDFIKALEFSHVDLISPEDGERIGNIARQAGFETWSIHSEHLNVGDKFQDYYDLQKHEAEVCAALGCKVMVCHLPNLVPYIDFERDLEVIGKVAEITRSCGVKLAVETCGYWSEDKVYKGDYDLVIKVVEALDLPDVGINLDSGHCFLADTGAQADRLEDILSGKKEQTIAALVRRIGKKLFTTHLHDNFGLYDGHQNPGMGYIDWNALVPAILETGYQGPLMMELTDGPKARRTINQLRKYPLEKEIIAGGRYLQFLADKYGKQTV